MKEIVDDLYDDDGFKKVPISEEEFWEFRKEFKYTPKEILSTFRLLKSKCSKEFVKKYPHFFRSKRKTR